MSTALAVVVAGLVLSGCSTAAPLAGAASMGTHAVALPASAAASAGPVVATEAATAGATYVATDVATAVTGVAALPDQRLAAPDPLNPDPITPPAAPTPFVLSDTDPLPRIEPAHRGANRPYIVAGRQYMPRTELTEHRERGMASWYGHAFHGRATSSGERFDMHGLSAAHKTLPIPSYVRVTHVRNGRSVVVRINDRGPFSSVRVIDLSMGAAQRLGMTQSGTAEVELQLLAAPQGYSSAMLARRPGALAAHDASASAPDSIPPVHGVPGLIQADGVRVQSASSAQSP